ncbi:MAG: peptidoglycan DD-metalloendopeptidase family protein [Peptococcaceae bacterium]|nr:peptidoglycan DD-metalloendopeptidase family protein [Peptococcaceae bacterium]
MNPRHLKIIVPTGKQNTREITLPGIVSAMIPIGIIAFTLLVGAIIAVNMSQHQYIIQTEPQISYITDIETQLAGKNDEIEELTGQLEDINNNLDAIASLQNRIHAMLDSESGGVLSAVESTDSPFSDTTTGSGSATADASAGSATADATVDASTDNTTAEASNGNTTAVASTGNTTADASTGNTTADASTDNGGDGADNTPNNVGGSPDSENSGTSAGNKFSSVNKVIAFNKVFSLDEASEQTQSLLFSIQAHYDEVLSAYEDKLQHMPNMLPVSGALSSPFGYRPDPFNTGVIEFHNGIDLVAPYGTPIKAPADGRILSATDEGGWGQRIRIDHGYGIVTFYAHLSQMGVQSGQEVKRGDTIGYLGNTGRSTGNHLHYGAFVNGQPFNPLEFLRITATLETRETDIQNPVFSTTHTGQTQQDKL